MQPSAKAESHSDTAACQDMYHHASSARLSHLYNGLTTARVCCLLSSDVSCPTDADGWRVFDAGNAILAGQIDNSSAWIHGASAAPGTVVGACIQSTLLWLPALLRVMRTVAIQPLPALAFTGFHVGVRRSRAISTARHVRPRHKWPGNCRDPPLQLAGWPTRADQLVQSKGRRDLVDSPAKVQRAVALRDNQVTKSATACQRVVRAHA